MKSHRLANTVGIILLIVAVIAYCQYFLSYLYYYIEQFGLFQFTADYARNELFQVGGVARYISAFIIQFFVHPYVGAIVSGVLSLVIFSAMYSCIRKIAGRMYGAWLLSTLPMCTLLWAGNDYSFHFVEGALAMIFSLWVLRGYLSIYKTWLKIIYFIVCVSAGYYGFGLYIGAFAFGAFSVEFFSNPKKNWWSILYLFVFLYPWENTYHHYMLPVLPTYYMPLFSVFVCMIMVYIYSRILKDAMQKISFMLVRVIEVVLSLTLFYTGMRHYYPASNLDAMQMDYYTRVGEWDNLLRCSSPNAARNTMNMCCQNLALSHMGRLSEDFMFYPQRGVKGLLLNWNRYVNSSFLLSDIYYHIGAVALSQEMAFEGMIASEHAISRRMLIRLIQTNLILGHEKVALKYIRLLSRTYAYAEKASYYKQFADNPELIVKDKDLYIRKQCISGTRGLTNSHNPFEYVRQILEVSPVYEPAAAYYGSASLMTRNIQEFRYVADAYLRSHKTMPVSFQEALIILYENDEGRWVDYGISKEVQDNFNRFKESLNRVKTSKIGMNDLKKEFGGTYWYYFMFKQ